MKCVATFDTRVSRVLPAKADTRAVFVGSDFSLLSGEKDYSIAHNYEIVDWDRLTELVTRILQTMAIPDYETLMLPLLRIAAEANGQEVSLVAAGSL